MSADTNYSTVAGYFERQSEFSFLENAGNRTLVELFVKEITIITNSALVPTKQKFNICLCVMDWVYRNNFQTFTHIQEFDYRIKFVSTFYIQKAYSETSLSYGLKT